MRGSSEYWFVVALLAGLAAYSLRQGFRAWRKNRTIGDTPTSRVRSAAQGYVELTGKSCLPPQAVIRAPLTGLPCTWWSYTIEDRETSSRRGRQWSTIDSATSEAPFLLDDGTGQCLVDPRGAEVLTQAKTVWYGSEPRPLVRIAPGTGVFDRLVDKVFTGRYRYTERRLVPQAPLYALGEFRSVGGAGSMDVDAAITRLLHEWKKDQAGLLARFDADHDGSLDAGEWEQARAAARAQVLQDSLTQAPPPAVHVLGAPDDGRAFLLAASDEESLTRRFRLQAVAGIASFVVAAAALAWLLRIVPP